MALALVLMLFAGSGGAATRASGDPVGILSPNGPAGGKVAGAQGSDQGEDQGENVQQFGRGPFRIGPTLVKAENSITSGDANGGTGGNVTAIFNNVVTTNCTAGANTTLISPLPITFRSGNGGAGGMTGAGQGSDQGEDQGENVGQRGRGPGVGPTTISAINKIEAGLARGGNGGSVDIVFNQYTQCIGATAIQTPLPPPSPGVQKDVGGDITATFVTNTTCTTAARQPIEIQAGNGGNGGWTGLQQGTDQGEDQGENIGQFAKGTTHKGPTSVVGNNVLTSPDANGAAGRNVTVTFDNYIDTSCGSGPSSANGPIVVQSGKGGAGGQSGNEQGSDQGEDQGENVGQFAAMRTVVGPVVVEANNSILSGDVDGGAGGKVTITYNVFGACTSGTNAAAAGDERVTATAGGGGAAGRTGRAQGADQGENQGENVGQFAMDGSNVGSVNVSASNSNHSGSANGGTGGDVSVTFHSGGCATSRAASESVDGGAGRGGRGGETGRGQGSDQGEDQGENIGKNAAASARFAHLVVSSVNQNISGDALGGDGGDVEVTSASCTGAIDPRVSASTGGGGAAGQSGKLQGADQAEDQGENVGLAARSTGGAPSVSTDSKNIAGQAGAGTVGLMHTSCTGALTRAVQVSRAPAATHVTARAGSANVCRGAFRGAVLDVVVPSDVVCKLAGVTVRHNIEVNAGGKLITTGVKVGHDIVAFEAGGLRILGGKVGHSIVSEALSGKPLGQPNAICGVIVAHNVLVADSTPAAGSVVIGGRGCRGNRINHDLQVVANAAVIVTFNYAGHDATCQLNVRFAGGANRAVNVNSCLG